MNKETKICKRCGVEKPLDEFRKDRRWFRNNCRFCERDLCKIWRADNPEKSKSWQKNNKEKRRIIDKRYRTNNPRKRYEIEKNWKKRNPEKVKIYNIKGSHKYYKKNKNDSSFCLKSKIRNVIGQSLRKNGGSKSGRHWESLVGYSASDLKKHIENLFTLSPYQLLISVLPNIWISSVAGI